MPPGRRKPRWPSPRSAARSAGPSFLRPLPDRFRDGDLRDLRAAAMRGRAAFGPKDSLRDVLPAQVTEPLLEAVDGLLRELNRYDRAQH